MELDEVEKRVYESCKEAVEKGYPFWAVTDLFEKIKHLAYKKGGVIVYYPPEMIDYFYNNYTGTENCPNKCPLYELCDEANMICER